MTSVHLMDRLIEELAVIQAHHQLVSVDYLRDSAIVHSYALIKFVKEHLILMCF
jgi:hypothetical protein